MRHIGSANYIDLEGLAQSSPELDGKKRTSFLITCRWYLAWIHRNKRSLDVSSAREFIAEVTNTKQPSTWQLEQWKEAINWLFSKKASEESSYIHVSEDSETTEFHKQMRVGQYSSSTEKTYGFWINKFARWFHPNEILDSTDNDLRDFLSYLAVQEKVSKGTQSIALNSLIYYCRRIQKREPGDLSDFRRARAKKREPVVLSQNEVKKLLDHLKGTSKIMASIMYGGGLRISELLDLRIKDIDLERMDIIIHGGKGDKDRRTLLPTCLTKDLSRHLIKVHNLWSKDQEDGLGPTILPESLAKKFKKQASSYEWQWLFPGRSTIWNEKLKAKQRVNYQPRTFQKQIRTAAKKASIHKRISPHVLRHCFATHMIESGMTIDRLQELMGHSSIETTRIYLHVARNENEISPLDRLYT